MSSGLALFDQAEQFGAATAIVTPEGAYGYDQLLNESARIAAAILDGASDLQQGRVAFLVPPGFDHVATQWGIWRCGGVAVPLGLSHPLPELEYVINDSQASTLIAHPQLIEGLRPVVEARSLRLLSTDQARCAPPRRLPHLQHDRRAMILYTSGTTSRPKGVVTTHANIQAQVEALVEAWEWTSGDHILHILPLHHIHGIINILTCSLWAGARCEFLPRFDAEEVWRRFDRGDLTLFMAVPTVYARLIAAWEQATPQTRRAMSQGCAQMRLMVSGSAALPVATLERWKTLTGHVLLERYGMTEIGMALSNPLRGERVAGHVGFALPNIELRRVDEAGNLVEADVPGEIEVRGPGVFLEYWQKPEATRAAFRDGWFRTGDVAVVDSGGYRILGRKSVDIIKTGGYKVSALEIEEVLRTHPHIRDCAVVGVADQQWGERVAACVVSDDLTGLSLDELRDWAKQRLAVYKIPTRLLVVEQLPRNAMGKVQKPAVADKFRHG